MDEAAVAALTEIAERDAEATTPYSRTRCFMLRSRDQLIQSLLDDYAACGIRVQFQDLTTELGLPVYQCFVTGARRYCRASHRSQSLRRARCSGGSH